MRDTGVAQAILEPRDDGEQPVALGLLGVLNTTSVARRVVRMISTSSATSTTGSAKFLRNINGRLGVTRGGERRQSHLLHLGERGREVGKVTNAALIASVVVDRIGVRIVVVPDGVIEGDPVAGTACPLGRKGFVEEKGPRSRHVWGATTKGLGSLAQARFAASAKQGQAPTAVNLLEELVKAMPLEQRS